MKTIKIILIIAVLVVVGVWAYEKWGNIFQRPFVKVISPNGGETIKTGETMAIQWESYGVDYVDIAVGDPDISYFLECRDDNSKPCERHCYEAHIVQKISAKQGEYIWKVPSLMMPNLKGLVRVMSSADEETCVGDTNDASFSFVK